MTTVTQTTPPEFRHHKQHSASELLSTPDLAYLNWAFTNLDFMTNEQDKTATELITVAAQLDLLEGDRLQALERLSQTLSDDIHQSLVMYDTLQVIKQSLFELITDASIDVRMEAYTGLIFLAILKRKQDDSEFRRILSDRDTPSKEKVPLGNIEYALVFELAMDVYSQEEKGHDLDAFYQVFREFASIGRKLIM